MLANRLPLRALKKDLAIHFVKAGLGIFLMAEYLDNLLTGHHLFHKGFSLSQSDLLAQEVFGGTVRDIASQKSHADDAGHHNQP